MAEVGVPPPYGAVGQNDPLPDGLYILTNKMSRTVLDLSGGTSSGGTRCAGYSRNTNDYIDHQLWIIEHNASNNTYTIKNLRGGTYLDLQGGKRENGSRVTCYPRSLVDGSRKNQEWQIIERAPNEHRIRCTGTRTYIEISGGNTSNGTNATCSAKVDGGAHQLWSVERVSRTAQEIKALLGSWKPNIASRLFQPYEDDAGYFVLPFELRKTIWERTKLQRQTVRKHVFDYDDFVIKAKDAVSSWARDRLRVDEFSVLFGVVYGDATRGAKAYNWYLSPDMKTLVFFDAQTGKEYTTAGLDDFGFVPSFVMF